MDLLKLFKFLGSRNHVPFVPDFLIHQDFMAWGGGGSNLPEIANSLRFDGANDVVTRTHTATGSGQKFTLSMFVKRSNIGANQVIFMGGNTTNDYTISMMFNTSDSLVVRGYSTICATSSAKYRDTSAHFHIVLSVDTTLAAASDRHKLYADNTLVASGGITQNWTYLVNAAVLHAIGGQSVSWGFGNFDGYVSNVCLIDGQALDPSYFGYTDPNNQWRSKPRAALAALASSGGTNSFFLPFDNGTSTTTLGYDASSKGNNWTLTNMVRDGSANDCWMLDTPTNNFATLNPLHTGRSTISNGGLTASGSTDLPTILPDYGNWYFEVNGVGKTWTPPAAFPTSSGDYNFGQRPVNGGAFNTASGGYFLNTPPAGYKALCAKNLNAGSITTSGTFTGNASADGTCIFLNGTPTAMSINGNAVTWGTHADKLANGFKLRTSLAAYNASGSNSFSVITTGSKFKYANAQGNP